MQPRDPPRSSSAFVPNAEPQRSRTLTAWERETERRKSRLEKKAGHELVMLVVSSRTCLTKSVEEYGHRNTIFPHAVPNRPEEAARTLRRGIWVPCITPFEQRLPVFNPFVSLVVLLPNNGTTSGPTGDQACQAKPAGRPWKTNWIRLDPVHLALFRSLPPITLFFFPETLFISLFLRSEAAEPARRQVNQWADW